MNFIPRTRKTSGAISYHFVHMLVQEVCGMFHGSVQTFMHANNIIAGNITTKSTVIMYNFGSI